MQILRLPTGSGGGGVRGLGKVAGWSLEGGGGFGAWGGEKTEIPTASTCTADHLCLGLLLLLLHYLKIVQLETTCI